MKIGIVGASIDVDNKQIDTVASELGAWLVENNHSMVYIGNAAGLIKVVLTEVERAGGKSIQIAGTSIDDMLPDVDAFVFLPGGVDVFASGIHLLNLCEEGIFSKPFLLLNIDDFWSPLQHLMGKMESENYISKPMSNVCFCESVESIVETIG